MEGQAIGVYNLRRGTSRQLPSEGTSSLTINGPLVAWSEDRMSGPDGLFTSSIQAANLDTGARTTVLAPRPALLRVIALVGQRAIAYLVDSRVYLRDLPAAP